MATPITPQTNVFLLKCPLEMDNQHQMNFSNATTQHNYFMSLPKLEFDEFSYQRADGVIRVDCHIDDIIGYNYVMYQNENYTNKWFYAFITGMEYVNDHCTFISIKTDVWQTWQFDLTFNRCFVEREHVNNDTFGLHTLDENLPTGEWISNGLTRIGLSPLDQRNVYVMCVLTEVTDSIAQNTTIKTTGSRVYNSIPSGCYVIGIDIVLQATQQGITYNYQNLTNFIEYYDYIGKGDTILAMYIVPKSYIPSGWVEHSVQTTEEEGSYSFDILIPTSYQGVYMDNGTTITRNTTLNGYTPKNNKLFTKQFNYLLVTNHVGTNATYNWEEFSGDAKFYVGCAQLSMNAPSRLIPDNYKGTNALTNGGGGYIYGMDGSPFPCIAWASDYYLNWQAQTGQSQLGKYAKGFFEDAEKHTGDVGKYWTTLANDVVGFGSGLINGIVNTLTGANVKAERTPDPAKGDINGNLTYSIGKCCFGAYKMSVKAETAKIVDDYFTAFGYKVATYKVPNITGRLNWNYVKLNEANITGNIPQEDMEEIKGYFLKGLTFWHNPSTFLDYSQNNNIV